MNLREKIARAIAIQRTGCDPDGKVYRYVALQRVEDGLTFLPPDQHTQPLWTCYLDAADAAFMTIQKELETVGIIVAWSKD